MTTITSPVPRAVPTEGVTIDTTTGALLDQPLWQPLANVVVWTLIFALLATWLVPRGRSRQ